MATTVTVTHTAVVFFLAILSVVGAQWFSQDRAMEFLVHASVGLVILLGLWMVWQRWA